MKKQKTKILHATCMKCEKNIEQNTIKRSNKKKQNKNNEGKQKRMHTVMTLFV